jgi:hypothetical protein
VGDGLPDLEVVQGRVRLVEAEVPHVEGRAAQDRVPALLQGVDVGGVDEVVAVDVAGLERLAACRAVGDRHEDEVLDLRDLAPVVVVSLQHQLAAAVPGDEPERAGPDRVLGAVGAR